MMKVIKNAAAYQVRRSAVKNVHVAKSGIASAREANPAKTNKRGFRIANRAPNARKNNIS